MSDINNTDTRLSVRERLCFSFGDLGYQCVFYWVTAFLMIFYTDVFLIPAAAVSVLMLVVRLYDAVNDPIIGSLMDRTRSRMGRYRPWILFGGIGLMCSIIFMFWAHPAWSENHKIVYMYITYMVVVTFSTIFYMAYMALNGCISTDSLERAKASSWRMVMSYVGMLLVGYLAPYMITFFGGTNAVKGYFISVLICAVIGLPMILSTAFGTREVIGLGTDKVKIPMKQQWKALLKNKPMLILLFCMTAHGIQMNGRLMIATYYCTYVGGGAAILATFNLLNSLFAIVGSIAAPSIFQIVGHKGRASSAILYLCAMSMLLQYFVGAPSIGFFILVSITGFCYGAFSALMFSMIPDAVDYAQYRHGVRVDGFLNAMASFGFKLGGALATSMLGVILSVFGYVANAQQTQECLNAIRTMMTVLPGVICAIAATTLLFYSIDRKKQQEIMKKLQGQNVL